MKKLGFLILSVGVLLAQPPNPTQQRGLTPNETGQPMPIFRVTVVSRTIKAVNYHHRRGSTQIDFRGTELMPAARGQAKVESQMGSTKIETTLERMSPANQYGPEFLTFVLWGITPEGRANNLGEVVLNGDKAKLLSTTELQAFGLMVTAEPYFAVTQPSDVVVAENFIRTNTTGTIASVDAKYELLQRGTYVMDRARYVPVKINPKGPLQLAEAENAVAIARMAGADRYAADTFAKAVVSLRNAQDFLLKSNDRKRSETNAREAAQMAEDARIITYKRIQAEQLANERAAAAQREATAQAEARRQTEEARRSAEEARLSAERARFEQDRRAQAEAERVAAERAKLAAENAKRDAEDATARALSERSAAEAARAAALAQQQASQLEAERAKMAAQEADRLRLSAENEKAQLRERLRQQLNLILETRESARGLIVNISDVLFDFNKYTLKPAAREKMAKVSGILLAYPGLKIQLEGHTDSIGSEEYNQTLSEQRANAVREFIVSQAVPAANVTSKGLGKSQPVASNETAAGRQQNRRVELIVSGEPIGIKVP